MSAAPDLAREKRFDWPLCYDAENYILARLEAFTERNSFARRLAERMLNETGTLLLDWVDYLVVPHAEEERLHEIGFTEDPLAETPAHLKALWHPGSHAAAPAGRVMRVPFARAGHPRDSLRVHRRLSRGS